MPDDPFDQTQPDADGGASAVNAGKPVTTPSGSGHWFVPPPTSPGSLANGGRHVDMRQVEGEENIVVTATRRPIQRDPHPLAVPDDSPQNSLAATPEQGNAGQGACHSSAYQTIAGQPATGMDMISEGGGRCE